MLKTASNMLQTPRPLAESQARNTIQQEAHNGCIKHSQHCYSRPSLCLQPARDSIFQLHIMVLPEKQQNKI